jgi:hypothetical protein
MLKIVSSLNGFSVRQSVVSDSPRYRAAVAVKKYNIFHSFYYLKRKKFKKILFFGKKMIFSLIFLGHKTTYGRRPKNIFQKKPQKNDFFLFFRKK